MALIQPIVFKKGGEKRVGRGFSRGELKKAGLSPTEAQKLKLPVDLKRKTLHTENVGVLKKLLKSKKEPTKRRRKSKGQVTKTAS